MASSSGAKQNLMVKNGEEAANYVPYPAPLARYEDLVINSRLFMEILEKLHSTMGTKFMIPIIGGKDLDLHRLFVEVTSRGGFEKIMNERRWKEVTNVFNFPPTATNASFVLRKYYKSLLHHFEQIYFFKASAWTPLPDALQGVSYSPAVPQIPTEEQPQKAKLSPEATSATAINSQVIGVIDGKFDNGYLVSVTIGSEKLKGILYNSSHSPLPHHPNTPKYRNNSPLGNYESSPATSAAPRRRRRKKSEMKKRDPAKPKPNRSGYNFFFAEQHARLKPLYAGKDREISRMIGELWTNLKEEDKLVYQEKAANDKERYRTELRTYMEKFRNGQIIDAVPLQQLPIGIDSNFPGPSEGTDDIDHDSEWETSHNVEIGSEDVPNEEVFLEREGSESVHLPEDIKIGNKNANENRNGSLEEKNTLDEGKDAKIPEEEKGESEKKHEAEHESMRNENGSITMLEKESIDIEKDLGGEDVAETHKRSVPVEENDLTTNEKRQKVEDEV